MALVLEVSEDQVIALLSQMPTEQRTRILAHFATASGANPNENAVAPSANDKPRRVAGKGKDHILYIADDFDAPLEDMKEYME